MVYDFFLISIRVWRQIGVENGPFLVFEKKEKSLKNFAKIHDWKKRFSNFGPRKKFRGSEPIILDPQLFVGGFSKGLQFMIASNHKSLRSEGLCPRHTCLALNLYWYLCATFRCKWSEKSIYGRKRSQIWNPFENPPTKSRGSKMMCSDPRNFLRGPKLENHFFQ